MKIKALLEKIGLTPAVSEEVCNVLERYKDTVRKQLQSEYASKVEQAKKVCIEETNAHKRELARRVQIFCETKGAAIEAQLAKQSALNESEAMSKLSQISALLDGLKNGVQNGDVTAELEKLKRKAQIATEERDKAIAVANKQTAIAEKVIKRNRELTVAIEQKRSQSKPTVAEGANASKRIDGSRNGNRARSTRATLRESQERHPTMPSRRPHISGGGSDIAAIADTLDD